MSQAGRVRRDVGAIVRKGTLMREIFAILMFISPHKVPKTAEASICGAMERVRFKSGDFVILRGLDKRADLNGQQAKVMFHVPEAARYAVRIRSSREEVRVGESLQPAPRSLSIRPGPRPAPARPPPTPRSNAV